MEKFKKEVIANKTNHNAQLLGVGRGIFFSAVGTGKLPCFCKEPFAHTSVSSSNETH